MSETLDFYLDPDHALATAGAVLLILIALFLVVQTARDVFRR